MAYRNIYFCRRTSKIHLFHYNSDGEPIKSEYFFKPYLYLPAADTKEAVATGIDDVKLIKKEFNKEWERRKFVESYKGKVYFNLPATQQYLLENHWHENINDLTQYPLRTFFFDIEVIADEFPTATESKFPLTSITVYDTLTKKYYTWGIKKYDHWSCKDHLKDIEPEDIVYEYCIDEKTLIVKFLKFWRKNFPDLITGWNSSTFDIPYIIGRITKVLGEEYAAKLSPVDNVYGIEKTHPKFQNKYIDYTIGGIAHLDYMFLYKTFTPGERESDGLDYICWDELGEGKLEYGDMSLKDLCDKDWNRFINYNIWDVALMVKLDNVKRYLEIAKFSAFSGFCNLDKAFGKTAIITGVLAKQSLEEGRIIYTQTGGTSEKIPGGYVKLPGDGLIEAFLSFDANSLYPSNIITLNISPESKVAKITHDIEDNYKIFLFRERKYIEIKKNTLHEFIREKGWSLSPCGIMFDQTKQSIASKFCDTLYTKRKKVKTEMFNLEAEQRKFEKTSNEYKRLDITIRQKDVEQYLYKILLNSTYGAFAEKNFALYDIDCAKSITTSGQSMIKQSENIVNNFICQHWNLDVKDRIKMIDTDSIGISIIDVLDKLKIDIADDNGDLTEEFTQIENAIGNHLNTEINRWAVEKFNTKDSRYFFKRESVCPKAIWTGKKHYILYLINKEGVKMNKFKYSGLQIAKSVFGDSMKTLSKQIVEILMLERDKKKAEDKIYDMYDKFTKFSVNEIAQRGGIKVLSKWEGKNNGFTVAKGTTGTAKFCIWHNELLKQLNLQNKYRRIENGSKIKMVLLKDNQYNIPGIAYQDIFPPEFNLEVDYEKMFFKAIVKSLEPIYNSMGWDTPNPRLQYEYTLEDLFK